MEKKMTKRNIWIATVLATLIMTTAIPAEGAGNWRRASSHQHNRYCGHQGHQAIQSMLTQWLREQIREERVTTVASLRRVMHNYMRDQQTSKQVTVCEVNGRNGGARTAQASMHEVGGILRAGGDMGACAASPTR